MTDRVDDLLAFIDSSPTPYHAVRSATERLEAAGYSRLEESEIWSLEAGAGYYVVRAGGSLAAFEVGRVAPSEAGFRVVGAHTDSPNLRIKPEADVFASGYHQLAVEPYGGVLLHTWLDRDLSLAGRATLRDGTQPGASRTALVDFRRALLRVPSLAIHLYRELKTDGLKLNAQRHMVPVLGLSEDASLGALLCDELERAEGTRPDPEALLAHDLMAYDLQPSARSGAAQEFVHAARLDNLASSHAGLCALLDASAAAAPHTRVVVLYDHEEVGSRSSQGAGGTFLKDVLERIVAATEDKGDGCAQAAKRAVSRSWLITTPTDTSPVTAP
jgi:aspartyl aminopeptidase